MNQANAIAGCKKGDRQAQKQVFEAYSKMLLHVCKRYVPNSNDAEELLLTGFYKFFAAIDRFDYVDDASLGAWLKRIVVNECLMFLRSSNKVRFIGEDDNAADAYLDEEAFAQMNAKDIVSLINTIPDGYRIVFCLYVIEGYNHNEIAQLLGISAGTSKSQLMRAKVYLQKLLKENGVYATR